MYQCAKCKEMFDSPGYEQICFETEYGVGSLFSDYHYGSVPLCPECGSDDIEEFMCDECCWDCDRWKTCTLEERQETIDEYE